MAFIEFKNVSKSFGKKTILSQLNLEVIQGETLTIMGGSGSGKSITLKLLLGLIDPDAGEIIFNGENIVESNEEALIRIRSKIGMLFQSGALFDSLTVFENIAYPLREHFDFSEDEIAAKVKNKLQLVGLAGSEEMYPADLSGGMKKRVGLARAIATEPEVILYDEPTTGLDPSNTKRIDDLIIEMQKVLKVTSIVVTHDMQSAFDISDRIALLYKGKIAFVGTVDEVKSSKNEMVQNFINGEMGQIEGRQK